MHATKEALSKSIRDRLATRTRMAAIPDDARQMMLESASEIDWLRAQLEQERIHGEVRSQEAHAVIMSLLGEKGLKAETGQEVLDYFADVGGAAGFDVPDWTARHEDATISEFASLKVPKGGRASAIPDNE